MKIENMTRRDRDTLGPFGGGWVMAFSIKFGTRRILIQFLRWQWVVSS